MELKKYNYLYYTLGLLAIISFVLFYFVTPAIIAPDVEPEIKGAETASAGVEGKGRIEFYKHYLICNHILKDLELKSEINDAKIAELQNEYLSQEGWSIQKGEDKIKLVQKINELCPEDAEKRHLAASGEYLGVFKGPVGINGGLERITDIKIKSLPTEWQEKIHRGLLDFSSEAELLEALDSLDEYE